MSSRSPRGSVSGISSEDVAADFEDYLKDLQANNRYEISNLTIIAKENTEHAEAISRTLENHIKTTSPSRKLPALYVLDSIVKNVGTPYTTYLGRNLFSTFMDAYVLVDTATRKHLENMLQTWKAPVPGSIDSRPVFPPENVRPIDNALIKAKTAAIQNQRQRDPSQTALRSTATPPQQNSQFLPPPGHAPAQTYPGPPYPQAQTGSTPYTVPEIESLKRDIAFLISRDTHMLSFNPNDSGLRMRLQALSDLQTLLNIRSVNPSELQAIRAQVQQISASGPPPQSIPPQPPQWTAPTAAPPFQAPPGMFPTLPNQPPSSRPTPPVLNAEALSGLQALLANAPKPSTPQMRAAVPSFRDAPHPQLNAIQNHTAAVAPSAGGAADLLSSLAKAGLIKPGPSVTPKPANLTPAPLPQEQAAALLKSLQSVLPPLHNNAAPPITTNIAPTGLKVPLSAAALKVFRPELVASIYESRPNQCSTCGRRFTMTDDAREKKSRHLDWHFRTNQRIADPNHNRGHHRNWYVDELEWVKHVEFDPSTATASGGDSAAASKQKKANQAQFVRAPPGMTKNTCNICFEEMNSSYSEDLQDWIFTDATINNGKIVHAQCLAEMSKSQAHSGLGSLANALSAAANTTRERSATPDSTLGKRKAESAMAGGGVRMKMS